jgi:hypothetical protein
VLPSGCHGQRYQVSRSSLFDFVTRTVLMWLYRFQEDEG